ncbi:hypothetical protein [Corynebacterium pseudodiphtheriticum]|uniref:hypothetical protein n=1 Tax=Corynebacterium pseudodiphtheriticum TaxID=37637 RepID=UPI001F5FFEBF|nr:hypothetical protein [Corynebacterium pseudodiphtheriticum]MDK4304824.1 hypothetical protein [Corynebacterium pseudodiphtheriticum]MDK4316932.1 hypothetical protein [Corynebacterium pseudodiphtheriticum]
MTGVCFLSRRLRRKDQRHCLPALHYEYPTEIVARLRSEVEDGSLESFCLELGIDLLVLFGSACTDAHSAGDADLAYSVDFSRTKEDRPNLLDVATAFYVRYGVDAGDTMDFMNSAYCYDDFGYRGFT